MLLAAVSVLLVILLPVDAHAWGGGIHLQLGSQILGNLQALPPALATLLWQYPHDFLYGCIAADITVGKRFTHYLLNCHRWRIGLKVLQCAEQSPQQACAWGYLAHLAADTVAHNYYVPFKTMRSFTTMTMKHAYWEMRFEHFVDREVWETARTVAQHHFLENDKLLRRVIADTLFSFGTNKRIFNSILLVSRLEQWQQVLKTVNDVSRFDVDEEDREDYMGLAREAILDVLNLGEESRYFQADPTGERALQAAEAVSRNLRLLYRSGKLTKAEAEQQLERLKLTLREAICEPERLSAITSAG